MQTPASSLGALIGIYNGSERERRSTILSIRMKERKKVRSVLQSNPASGRRYETLAPAPQVVTLGAYLVSLPTGDRPGLSAAISFLRAARHSFPAALMQNGLISSPAATSNSMLRKNTLNTIPSVTVKFCRA